MSILDKNKRFAMARSEGLLTEEVDSEKVIFDEESKQAHCLTPIAAIVFDHCDGKTSTEELARLASSQLGEPVTEEQAQQALTQLEERGLLASPLPIGISRREMVHKSAVFGAAAAAATMIFTIEPPMASAAQPCTAVGCSLDSDCTSSGAACTSGTCSHCNTTVTPHKCQCVRVG